jgi:isoleucyl-tRNA synthetase
MATLMSTDSTQLSTQNNQVNLVQFEHEMLEWWHKNDTFKQSLTHDKNQPDYVFYDGPPFATGLPHHGHLLAGTLKDIVPRYWTMRGYHVSRRFGWDCHGLPIEYEIDKQLGLTTHEAVAKHGVSGYNEACRSIVNRYTQAWEKTITRLGRWVDFEHDYKTMDPNFMESVWWVFQQLWQKDLIYQGTKVVPYSSALETVLSNFEASSNYQQVQDPAITVLFKACDEDAYFAIWTTTPWTLPANLGICVGEKITYVLVQDTIKNLNFYMAKERFEALRTKDNLTPLKTCTGADLKGRRYQPIFPYFENLKTQGAFTLLTDDFVSLAEGTGLVHMAPAFGEDDHRVMQQAGCQATVCPIDSRSRFTQEVTHFSGQYVKDADKPIIQYLKQHNHLWRNETIVHSYPFCPRSDTPLIYRSIPSWYVAVEKIKPQLLAANKKIHWVPEHMQQGRFGKWLEGARDWAISRNRVWGTPLPVWKNDTTGKTICMGSIAELETYTNTRVTDLHRDYVDDLTFTQNNEPGVYRRISEVLDCWFESGAMPYAQNHYPFENKELFEKNFPASFIAEGLDQTRGWFYTLNVLSVALFNQPAFKNVIVNGMIMAKDGKKMSKRLRNYTPPDELMETYGADALRLYMIHSNLVKGQEQCFSDDGVREVARKILLPWYNACKFFTTYAHIDGWHKTQHYHKPITILDHWLSSRIQSLTQTINQHMEQYHLYKVVPQLVGFIEALTNTYIRLNRERYWGKDLSPDKQAAYSTLFDTLMQLSCLMAPFVPFLSEFIYQQLRPFMTTKQPKSVHLCPYPQAHTTAIQPPLEKALIRLEQILILGRQMRNDAKIKIKVPLKCLTIIHKDQTVLDELQRFENVMQKELNIQKLTYTQQEKAYIKLYALPCSPVLGKRLGKRFGQFRALIQALTPTEIETYETTGSLTLADEIFATGDLLIYRQALPGKTVLSNRHIAIHLDLNVDATQRDEGLAREIINRIQKTRKQLNLQVNDRIHIHCQADEALTQIISRYQEMICTETLTLKISQDQAPKETPCHTFIINDWKLTLAILVAPR